VNDFNECRGFEVKAFSFYGVENWSLLRTMCGTKRLNPLFRFDENSEVLNKYVMGVWSDNFTAAFFVSFIVTVFVPEIEGIQNKGMFMFRNNLFSECNENV